jgi:hypothetical protein
MEVLPWSEVLLGYLLGDLRGRSHFGGGATTNSGVSVTLALNGICDEAVGFDVFRGFAIGFTDGLGSEFTGAFGACLGADDPATEDHLSRFGAHGGVTAGLAAASMP